MKLGKGKGILDAKMNYPIRKTKETTETEDALSENIRVMLIEGHELIRYGLRSVLEQEKDMEVVGDYSDAREAFSQLGMLCPDIVVMDVQRLEMNIIDTLHSLTRNGWDCVVLAESTDYKAEALEAGAARFLLKDVTPRGLAQAVRETYRNRLLPEEHHGSARKTIELVIPPPANAAQLLRLTCQLQEMLEDNCGDITQMVGSWDWGTVITVLLESGSLADLSERLKRMPDVMKIEESSTKRTAQASYPKQFGVVPAITISPIKTIRVILKGTGVTGEEPVSALSYSKGQHQTRM